MLTTFVLLQGIVLQQCSAGCRINVNMKLCNKTVASIMSKYVRRWLLKFFGVCLRAHGLLNFVSPQRTVPTGTVLRSSGTPLPSIQRSHVFWILALGFGVLLK